MLWKPPLASGSPPTPWATDKTGAGTGPYSTPLWAMDLSPASRLWISHPPPQASSHSSHLWLHEHGPWLPGLRGWRGFGKKCPRLPDLTPFLICEGSFLLAFASVASSTRNTILDCLCLTLSLHNKDILKNQNNLTLGKCISELQRDANSHTRGWLQTWRIGKSQAL